MTISDVPVTVVGGGPIGLAMSLALSRHGIASRIVERNQTTTNHPKARGCWVRTMEIFRQWGLEDAVRRRGLPDGADAFVVLESFGGKELGRSIPEPDRGFSPSRKSVVAQDAVEEELLGHVRAAPLCDVHFSTEFQSFVETAEGVAICAKDLITGDELSWNSQYLVAADGGGGSISRMVGIEMAGPPVMALMLNTYWKGDLSSFPVAREAGAFFFRPKNDTEPATTILNTDGGQRWLMLTRIGVDRDLRPRPLSDEETISRIREVVGLPGLKVELINESIWRMTRQIATSFRKGRVFLVGDAAHRFPPTGGFGMNSGIQDAHNLAWKLAFVLKGLAGDRLMDSYDLERRPAADSNADFSLTNAARGPLVEAAIRSGNLDRIGFWMIDAENHLHSTGQSLGFVYEDGALVADGTLRPAANARIYAPTDRPGSRFPHIWLDQARERSTIDEFDRDFVLVVGPKADGWIAAAREADARLGVPLKILQLENADRTLGLHIGDRGAALVRPDGVTAWRSGWLADEPTEELVDALQVILARDARSEPAVAAEVVEINGTRTAFTRRGSGPPLLLIHGGDGDRRALDEFAERLASSFTVISYDQRDCGGTTLLQPAGYDLRMLADDAAALIEQLGYERAHVYGNSLGGVIAQHLALRHPSKVDRLMLAATWPANRSLLDINAPALQLRMQLAAKGKAGDEELTALFTTQRFVRAHPAVVERFRASKSTATPESQGRRTLAIMNTLEDAHPKGIRARTLVVAGEDDAIVPSAIGESLAKSLPNAAFEMLPEAGHVLAWQAPQRLASLARGFFE